MKINAYQLDQELQKGLKNTYLVSGDEPLICIESVASITACARSKGYTEKIHCLLEQDSSMDSFVEHGLTGSLFASKRILSLQLIAGKLDKKSAEKLVRLIKSLGDNNVLIVSAPKLDKESQSTKWVKSIEQTGIWVQIWPVQEKQFSNWLHTRLRNYGAQISASALAMLSEMCSGNLLAADQQARKLALLYPDTEISVEALYKHATDDSRFDLFQVINFAFLGDRIKLLHSFERAVQEGLTPSALLFNLGYQLRHILAFSESRDRGENLSLVAQKMRLWQARQDIYVQVLKRVKTSTLLIMLRFCSRVDQQIKGGRQTADIDESLLALLLFVAGCKTPQLDEIRLIS